MTTSGRPQRESGISQIFDSIIINGWIENQLPVCSLMFEPGEEVNDEKSRNFEYLICDGNHRVAALRLYDSENGQDFRIRVKLHRGLSTTNAERFIADGESSC